MADIYPFRAWRYNPQKVRNVTHRFSPLFDVATSEQIEQLYRIPYNSIHLALPRSHEDAEANLRRWKSQGVFIQDTKPAIYPYYQKFSLFGQTTSLWRRGFIAMIRLDADQIIEHEATLPHSVADRVDLLERLNLNISPTHGLYRDPGDELARALHEAPAEPLYEYIDYQGVVNFLGKITDSAVVSAVQKHLSAQPIYLADGHHRLASSFAYRDRLAARNGGHLPADHPANFHMMFFSNLEADDLRILPTHRIWQPNHPVDVPRIRQNLSTWFDFTDLSRSRKPLYELVRGRRYAFGLVTLGRRWLMELNPKIQPEQAIELPLPAALKQLDYTVLHYFVFQEGLGIPYEAQSRDRSIRYEREYGKAAAAVNKSEAALSFICNEVDMEQMLAVCATGQKMPQKSTYFYPKVVSGLVFASIE